MFIGNLFSKADSDGDRWIAPIDDDECWIPVPPNKTEAAVTFETVDANGEVKSSVELSTNGDNIYDYDPNFPKKKLTRESIHHIFTFYNTVKLKSNTLTEHPVENECPSNRILLDRLDNLFLETDQPHFDVLIAELRRRFPELALEWKYGVLYVNWTNTKIYCSTLDEAYKILRKIGPVEQVEKLVADLVASQLGEIFVS